VKAVTGKKLHSLLVEKREKFAFSGKAINIDQILFRNII